MITIVSSTVVKITAEGAILRSVFNNGKKGWIAVSPTGTYSNEFTRKDAEKALATRASFTR